MRYIMIFNITGLPVMETRDHYPKGHMRGTD